MEGEGEEELKFQEASRIKVMEWTRTWCTYMMVMFEPLSTFLFVDSSAGFKRGCCTCTHCFPVYPTKATCGACCAVGDKVLYPRHTDMDSKKKKIIPI